MPPLAIMQLAATSPFAPRKWRYFRGAKGDNGFHGDPKSISYADWIDAATVGPEAGLYRIKGDSQARASDSASLARALRLVWDRE